MNRGVRSDCLDGGRAVQADAAVRENLSGHDGAGVERDTYIQKADTATIHTGSFWLRVDTIWRRFFCSCGNLFWYFPQVLDPRSGWGTLIPAVKLLVESDDDKLYFIFNGGLHMCFQVRGSIPKDLG